MMGKKKKKRFFHYKYSQSPHPLCRLHCPPSSSLPLSPCREAAARRALLLLPPKPSSSLLLGLRGGARLRRDSGGRRFAARGSLSLSLSRGREMKYVLVTGGVVSGLGKGVTASSIGVVLKSCGLRITSIKIGTCPAGNPPPPPPRDSGDFAGEGRRGSERSIRAGGQGRKIWAFERFVRA